MEKSNENIVDVNEKIAEEQNSAEEQETVTEV